MLAREVTALVHGDAQIARVEHASQMLFGEDITQLSADDVLAVFADVPATEMSAAPVRTDGLNVVDLVALAGLVPSKSEARRLVQSGGVSISTTAEWRIFKRGLARGSAIGGRVFVLRKGASRTTS